MKGLEYIGHSDRDLIKAYNEANDKHRTEPTEDSHKWATELEHIEYEMMYRRLTIYDFHIRE